MKSTTLFLRIHNSARSQMAEELLNLLCGDRKKLAAYQAVRDSMRAWLEREFA